MRGTKAKMLRRLAQEMSARVDEKGVIHLPPPRGLVALQRNPKTGFNRPGSVREIYRRLKREYRHGI